MLTFKQFINEGVYDPNIFKAIWLAGGPGSGKSFIAEKLTAGQGLKMINSDTMFEHLLKKAELSTDLNSLSKEEYDKAMELRAKGKDLVKNVEKNFLFGRLGVVIDGTGRDFEKIKKQKSKLESLGYDCFIIVVNTKLDVAQERNKNRERSINPKVVQQYWEDVQENIGKFQNLFKNKNIIIDNSKKIDNPNNDPVLNSAWKTVNSWLKSEVKNEMANKWKKNELSKKSS